MQLNDLLDAVQTEPHKHVQKAEWALAVVNPGPVVS